MSTSTFARSTRTTAGICAGSAVVLLVTAAAFRWSGQPTVVGIAMGIALLVLAAMWKATEETPRYLPAVTTMAGLLLVLAPVVLDYNDGDGEGNRYIAVAYLVHILLGLALAAVGIWSGKRLGVARVDKV